MIKNVKKKIFHIGTIRSYLSQFKKIHLLEALT